jgi:hypothetical protein
MRAKYAMSAAVSEAMAVSSAFEKAAPSIAGFA